MKILKTCTENELRAWCQLHWEELKIYLQDICQFFPEQPVFEFDNENLSVSLQNGLITVVPDTYEALSIRGIKEYPGWKVTAWRWEEDDWSDGLSPYKEDCTSETKTAAALTAKMLFELQLNQWDEQSED